MFKKEEESSRHYVVTAIAGGIATIQRENAILKIPDAGYSINQPILYDGSTVRTIPAESIITYI